MERQSKAMCSILEFDSRTKVVIYFQSKIQEAINAALVSNSDGNLTNKTVGQYTMAECIESLKKKAGVEWNKLTPHSRFGAVYKYVQDGEEGKFSVLSEQINLQNMDRYVGYFFE